MDKIVSIQNLTIEFNRNIEVVKNINLDVIKGKTTAIVGESGSGKTLSALSILKLLPNGAEIKNGSIFFTTSIFLLNSIVRFCIETILFILIKSLSGV